MEVSGKAGMDELGAAKKGFDRYGKALPVLEWQERTGEVVICEDCLGKEGNGLDLGDADGLGRDRSDMAGKA